MESVGLPQTDEWTVVGSRKSKVGSEARVKEHQTRSQDRCRALSTQGTRASLGQLELKSVSVRNHIKLKSEEPYTLLKLNTPLGYRSQVGRDVKFFLIIKDPSSRLT